MICSVQYRSPPSEPCTAEEPTAPTPAPVLAPVTESPTSQPEPARAPDLTLDPTNRRPFEHPKFTVRTTKVLGKYSQIPLFPSPLFPRHVPSHSTPSLRNVSQLSSSLALVRSPLFDITRCRHRRRCRRRQSLCTMYFVGFARLLPPRPTKQQNPLPHRCFRNAAHPPVLRVATRTAAGPTPRVVIAA